MAAAEELSNTDIVNRSINWAAAHFWDEVAAVKGAPVFFFASIAIVGAVLYFALRWYFRDKIDNRNEAIRLLTVSKDLLETQLALFEKKLAEINTTQGTPAVAQQIDSLRAELKSREWRVLTSLEKQSCVLALQRLEQSSIWIAYNLSADCELLASDLREIFENAGWEVMYAGRGALAAVNSVGMALRAENQILGESLVDVFHRKLGRRTTLRVATGPSTPKNHLIVGARWPTDTQAPLNQ